MQTTKMPNVAIHSKKTVLQIKDGENWVPVKGLKGFSDLGGGEASTIDVTDLDSDAKEKMSGLVDFGSVSFDFNFSDSDPGQLLLDEAHLDGEPREFRLIKRNGKGWSWTGNVKSYSVSGSVDAALTASAAVEVTGVIAKYTVTP